MRRIYLALLTLATLVTLAIDAQAECDCLWEGAFADVHADTDLVVSGKVIERKGNSIDVALDRIMSGTEHGDNIRVWLHTADLCRPEAELFPVDSQWVMALHRIEEDVPGAFNPHTPNVSYGRVGDYSLSKCGGYWLSLSADMVSGNLIDAPRWEHNPKMSPVLITLIDAYVRGELERDSLKKASREDPALRELMLDTKAFLREEN